MIRILYMSDLHLEMESPRLTLPGWTGFLARHKAVPAHPARGPMLDEVGKVDLVVLAGDIHNGLRGIIYAEQVARYLDAPVVYVAGNHEYYRHDMTPLLPALFKAAKHSKGRVHFLENTQASFSFGQEKLHVLGCTLWTDYELRGSAENAMRMAARRMNDHAFIQANGELFRPVDALARHRISRNWLRESLAALRMAEPDPKTLIVTHHAPDAAFLGSRAGEIAPAYASNMLAEFSPLRPTAWIHGHTHYRHESWQEDIHLASAPRGYVVYDGAAALEYRPGVLELG